MSLSLDKLRLLRRQAGDATPAPARDPSIATAGRSDAGDTIATGVAEPGTIEATIRRVLDAEPLAEPDLIAVAAADTLEPIDPKAPPRAIALMIAVRIGRTRLIDQRVVAVP